MKMDKIVNVVVLAVLLCLTHAAWAQDADQAQTPTSLLELLPDGDINAVTLDFWMVSESKSDFEQAGFEQTSLIHYSIQPIDGELVISMRHMEMDGSFGLHTTINYSAEGQVVYYSRESDRLGSVEGVVEDGSLVITPVPDPDALPGDEQPETRTIPLEDIEGFVPHDLMPLVFAYHIRQGHTAYRCAIGDVSDSEDTGELVVEDLGTETVELDGEQHEAHRLSLGFEHEFGESNLDAVVLDNGAWFSLFMKMDNYSMNSYRVSAEEGEQMLEEALERAENFEWDDAEFGDEVEWEIEK